MSAQIFSFAAARAAKLRTEDSLVGRLFQNLERGQNMQGISDELLIKWAVMLSKSGNKTIHEIVAEVEREIVEAQSNGR